MTNVVAIEFCEDFFKSETACYDWIRHSEYLELLRVSGFNLRRNGQAKLLTSERKRVVFQWSQGLGNFTAIHFHRPQSTVIIATAAGPRFTPVDLPTPLPKTVERERKKKEAHEARVAAAREKRKAVEVTKTPGKNRKGGRKPIKKRKTAAAYLQELEDTIGVKVGQPTDGHGQQTIESSDLPPQNIL